MPVLDFGGVESRIITQSGLMDRDRFDFRVCTFWKRGEAARQVEALGVRVDELGTDPSPRNPRALRRLAEYVFDRRIDVIHASVLEANLQAALVRRIPGAPCVAIEEVGMPVRSLRTRALFGAVYRLADVVVGVSQRTCDAVTSQHWLPAHKVRLIYNSLNPRYLEPPMPTAQRERALVLAVGRLVEVKNHETLLHALARLPPEVRPRLDIAGEGPLRTQLQARIDELGLAGDVRLLGFQRDVRRLLDEADAYVLSSFSEGTSISLAEAMARARPVLASRADGIDEAMVGYPNGWQVEPRDVEGWADGLRRLAALGSTDRRELGEKARRLVEARMSPSIWRRQLEALYSELAARTQARRARLTTRLGGRLAAAALGSTR
ncbi:MAG: glycosyltransferase [Myxococcota bacterium]